MTLRFASLASLAVFLASGCSSGDGSNTTGTSQTGASSPVAWSTVYGTVLTQCADHHSGSDAAGSLDLSTQSLAYANLVRVLAQGTACGAAASSGATPAYRVLPGNSAQSLLYQKLEGTESCGASMPDELPALPASEIALVKSWIDEGAPND